MESNSSYGWTPLSWAAEKGYEAVVKLPLGKSADVESKDIGYGRMPLSLAAERGHEAVVKLLLGKGANNGQTPLWWIATKGDAVVVKLLLEKEAVDLGSKDNNGWTPLL